VKKAEGVDSVCLSAKDSRRRQCSKRRISTVYRRLWSADMTNSYLVSVKKTQNLCEEFIKMWHHHFFFLFETPQYRSDLGRFTVQDCNHIQLYVLLTVHLGIILVNNQLDVQFFFHVRLFLFSTCFRQPCAHHQEN